MSGAWDDIQAVKNKRNNLRERLEKRKRERQDIFGVATLSPASSSLHSNSLQKGVSLDDKKTVDRDNDPDPEIEKQLVQILADSNLLLPINSKQIEEKIGKKFHCIVAGDALLHFIQKLAAQSFIGIKDVTIGSEMGYEVIMVEGAKVQSLFSEFVIENEKGTLVLDESLKRKAENEDDETVNSKQIKATFNDKKATLKDGVNNSNSDIMSLLSMPSTREKQSKQVGEEILELLSKPTAKERSLAEQFKSQGIAPVKEFCPHGTRIECLRIATDEQKAQAELEEDNCTDSDEVVVKELPDGLPADKCKKLHFKKIIQTHTDESLGDCSFLNTCFHMDTCKYVHYEVDRHTVATITSTSAVKDIDKATRPLAVTNRTTAEPGATLYPAQWIQCDLRYLDMTVLGKFAVVMADPPWDIHMELPYGTMSDDEMRQLGVPALQDDGLIFLWVTGRAMELGRECLKLWGYERVDELIWVKTNQLQRIIRTGRTGHWLNHGKEHCLVGMKGNPANLNRGLDCDVIVAEVRATSHKPDEIYGIIERLSPGTRKIELFGRPHNVQPNWITLGNQLDGIRLVDPDLISQFQKRYPDGNCMAPSTGINTVP